MIHKYYCLSDLWIAFGVITVIRINKLLLTQLISSSSQLAISPLGNGMDELITGFESVVLLWNSSYAESCNKQCLIFLYEPALNTLLLSKFYKLMFPSRRLSLFVPLDNVRNVIYHTLIQLIHISWTELIC